MEKQGQFPVLETQRLILREIILDDANWYLDHFRIAEIVEGTAFPGPQDLDAARKELERYILNPFKQKTGFRWGITEKGTNKLIGSCGFYNWIRGGVDSAEIGYDLNPEFWGKGIMTEALEVIITFGFERMGLNRIQALIPSNNARSKKLVGRLGFKKQGVLRERSLFQGKYIDDVCFSLLRREWLER